jgi:hypothetical protein
MAQRWGKARQAMSTALEDVCKTLNLADHDRSEKDFLAKTLVALAHQVPRDAALLRDRMLRRSLLVEARACDLVRAAQCGAL